MIVSGLRSGNRQMRRLFVLIFLNVAYSTAELFVGLFWGRIGLVSDAFYLTFGCGLLSFSLFAMAASQKKPDSAYTYGYKRLAVFSCFYQCYYVYCLGRQLFLLFISFSLSVEAHHAFIQDDSKHKHYLIVSAVTNLLVNLIGVWFFRNYTRINLVYRKAEDMNHHSVCLHVLTDSIQRWHLLVFLLLSALIKCWRQVSSREDIAEVSQARFWEFVPGHVIAYEGWNGRWFISPACPWPVS